MKQLHLSCFAILFFVFYPSTAQSESPRNPIIDSLRQAADMQTGEEKMLTIWNLVAESVYTPQQLDYARELEREAKKYKSEYYYGEAMFSKIFYYSTIPSDISNDSLLYYADEVKKSNLGLIRRTESEVLLVKYFAGNRDYELAINRATFVLNNAQNTYEKVNAYRMLSDIYELINVYEMAAEMTLKGLELCEKNPKMDKYEELRTLFYFSLASNYSRLDRYDLALKYSNVVIDEIVAKWEDSEEKANRLYDMRAIQANIYTGMGQYDTALGLLKDIEEQDDGHTYRNRVFSNYVYSKAYLKKKSYSKALAHIEKVLKIQNHTDFVYIKAEIFDSIGRYQEASKLKTEVITRRKAQKYEGSLSQIANMQTIYEVNRLEKEKFEREQKLQQIYVIGGAASLIGLLLVILFIFEKRNSRQLKAKNKKLFEKYKHLESNELELYRPKESANNQAITDKQQLYNNTVDYLLSTKEYTNPNMTRELLALKVGTNRQYLIEAIQDNTNETYSEFINNLRLEHARKLLLLENELTIEDVYRHAGFLSKTTFYKHFGLKYGMTPAEFKSFVNEENKINKK